MAELATAMVYVSDAGSVVRCAGCDAVLATVVQSEDRIWFGLRGITAVEVRDPSATQRWRQRERRRINRLTSPSTIRPGSFSAADASGK